MTDISSLIKQQVRRAVKAEIGAALSMGAAIPVGGRKKPTKKKGKYWDCVYRNRDVPYFSRPVGKKNLLQSCGEDTDLDLVSEYLSGMEVKEESPEMPVVSGTGMMPNMYGGIRKKRSANTWIQFVKELAKNTGMTYAQVLGDPKTPKLYEKYMKKSRI